MKRKRRHCREKCIKIFRFFVKGFYRITIWYLPKSPILMKLWGYVRVPQRPLMDHQPNFFASPLWGFSMGAFFSLFIFLLPIGAADLNELKTKKKLFLWPMQGRRCRFSEVICRIGRTIFKKKKFFSQQFDRRIQIWTSQREST